jgi:hypothetical protein
MRLKNSPENYKAIRSLGIIKNIATYSLSYLNANLNLPVVHLVSTDEALATESWRNNHPTNNRGNAVKRLPRG